MVWGFLHPAACSWCQPQIRCSVVSLVGEMHVAERIASCTGGGFAVVSNDSELRLQLATLTVPPPVLQDKTAPGPPFGEMVQWGFPRQAVGHALCACHVEDSTKGCAGAAVFLGAACVSLTPCQTTGTTALVAPHGCANEARQLRAQTVACA